MHPCLNFNLIIPHMNDSSNYLSIPQSQLTNWGRVTHICVDKLIIIGSDNGLSSDRCQAIIWTNVGLLSIGPLQAYFSENLIKIQQFSLNKMHMKMSSAEWRPSCLGLNVLRHISNSCWFYYRSSNPRFMETLRKIEKHPKCKFMDLLTYLLEPFQRFTRYPLMLKEVIKHLKGNEEERYRAETAHETIQTVTMQGRVDRIWFDGTLLIVQKI